MGSPSSTAAYLMHISEWDDVAEEYLRDALRDGSGHGCGGVPSAWPSSIFELSWAITALAESSIPISDEECSTIGRFLGTMLQLRNGTVGFAPGSLVDADDTAKSKNTLSDGDRKGHTDTDDNGNDRSLELGQMRSVLGRYTGHILQHASVTSSPRDMQVRLARELETFLLAHIDHAEDNYRFTNQEKKNSSGLPTYYADTTCISHNGIHDGKGDVNWVDNCAGSRQTTARTSYLKQYQNPARTFYNWVRSTSADHTSCPFSFAFFHCLLSATHGDVTGRGAKIAYLVEDACRHLASLCRMYNDHGSLARDVDELNLNSLNFPEFHNIVRGRDEGEEEAKAQLMSIAEYERCSLEVALDELDSELVRSDGQKGIKWMGAIRLFVKVTDLYGQIYVVKDIATKRQR
ncbi:hypothetical protein GGR52DRAFT_573358 [Hypoxylon sp. FL1284]|nr:hypothetical protein GGR52DRAFT_573358 [Hypoxylon sp. FL1284]